MRTMQHAGHYPIIIQSRTPAIRHSHWPGAASLRSRRRSAGDRLACAASAEAARLLDRGLEKYNAGDRMGGLKLWEESLAANPSPEQRRAALFNATCVHAGFGDVELAQITLREAVQSGLDFRAMTEDPAATGAQTVRLVASQQVLIRLRKFNELMLRKMKAPAAPPPPFASAAGSGAARGGGGGGLFDRDLSQLLETEMQGIDTSVVGIVRRVAILLAALTGLGTALFYIGLKYFLQDVA